MTFSVEIVGARNAQGRFDSMANRELVTHLYDRAGLLAGEIEKRFRDAAPVSSLGNQGSGDKRSSSFRDSIRGVALPSERGFEISITTSQPELAKWLQEGTAPHTIDAKNKSVLANRDSGDVFGPHVNHPGSHKHDGWEDRAGEEMGAAVTEEGNKIGHWVERKLGGRL